jgi:uncharacterized protein DUF3999
MTCRRFWLCNIALLLGPSVFATDLPSQWRAWHFSRMVQAAAAEQRIPADIHVPWEVFPRCGPGCGDLRLIDDQGQEVPFELFVDRGISKTDNYPAKLLENSFVAGKYTQLIADLGDKPPLYDQVRVLTPEADFIVWAELALSDDAHTWRIVDARAPISRFHARAIEGTQTIPFQGLNARYVRIRIFEPARQFPVSGVEVLNCISREPQRVPLAVSVVSEHVEDASESRWRANLGTVNMPVNAVVFTTDLPEFYRAVRIMSSDDGKEWEFRGSGQIYRYRQGDKFREWLRVEFAEPSGARYLRVEVLNGNDRPLSNARLELQGVPRIVIFRQGAGRTYRILYGNQKAHAPQYDLSHYLDIEAVKPVHRLLSLGPEEITLNYEDPRPYTERHPNLLWLAFGISILLLAYAALRALRTANPPAE